MAGRFSDIAFDERGYIAADVICIGCGYNLRGLLPDGRCPECGAPVSISFRGDVSWADPRWLRGVQRGLWLLIACIALWYVFDWAATRQILHYRESGKFGEEAAVWFVCMPVLAQTPTLKLTTQAMWLALVPQVLAVLAMLWVTSVPVGLALADATRRMRRFAVVLKLAAAGFSAALLVTAAAMQRRGFAALDGPPLFRLMVAQLVADFAAMMLLLAYMPRLLDALGQGGGHKRVSLAMRLSAAAFFFSAVLATRNTALWWHAGLTINGGSTLEQLTLHPYAVVATACFHLAVALCIAAMAVWHGKLGIAIRPSLDRIE